MKILNQVGHSLGGALAELDALSMSLKLPSDVNIRTVVFGTPRVGNVAYAKLFDYKVPNFKRINNMRGTQSTVTEIYLFCSCTNNTQISFLSFPVGSWVIYILKEKYICSRLALPYHAQVCFIFQIEHFMTTIIIDLRPENDDAIHSQCQIKTVPNILAGTYLHHVRTVNVSDRRTR